MSSPALHLESLNNSQRKAAGFGEPVPDQHETDRAAHFSLAEMDGLSEPIEELTGWMARRVLQGQHRLLSPVTTNPYAPHLTFG